MEVNEANLQALAQYLEQTLSPELTTRKAAEKFLEQVEVNAGYPVLLLQLMDQATVAPHIRVSASITLKNFTKRHWRVVEDVGDRIHESDRATIKTNIVRLMLKSPEQIQKQLSDAISIIGREDFPKKWPSLLNEMVQHFQTGDFHVINGVLRTAHSIFKRYRHEFKSQQLWEEIKFVLDNFAQPFTELFKATMGLAKQHASDKAALQVIFSSLTLIAKVFHSLNSQDLPEYFEDNMGVWMEHFHELLGVQNDFLVTDGEEEAGVLEMLKSQLCDNVAMYAQKYDEEFSTYLPKFVDSIWHLLLSTGPQPKYDLLVSNAIQFLASVADKPGYRKLFEDPAVLQSICEKVIVPNMEFRAADEEQFEDNPEEFIRRDIEGSDIDTRRRSACDLVRALTKAFEGPVIENFSHYIKAMFQLYEADPKKNWRNQDVALYLIVTLAARGSTARHGATQTSELVNVQDVFNQHILPLLQQQDVNEVAVLKADALKYVVTFRSTLAPDVLRGCIPLVAKLLAADSQVVHTYAAHAIERLLMVKDPQGQPAIRKEDLAPQSESLLTNLLGVLEKPESEENEYVMKAVMRTCSGLQDALLPLMEKLLNILAQKIVVVSKNPSKPHFNHYLFESLSLGIRVTCRASKEAAITFEQGLFPAFQHILETDVQEFAPYVFQILSLLLEFRGSGEAPDMYVELFPHLLSPVLWDRPGNVPPLVRLLQAVISRAPAKVAASGKLPSLLGVFQKLIASKTNDHEGFYLLNAIIEHLPAAAVEEYRKQIFVLLFQRLMSSKTTKYIKSLLVFFSLFAVKFGGVQLISTVDEIQPKMFGMVVERLFVPDVQKVSGPTERKICAVGITRMLTDDPAFVQGDYAKLWPKLLEALIGLFELPEDDSTPDDEHFIEIEDTPGYQTAYSQLAFAGKAESDPFGGSVPNTKEYLAKGLAKLSVGSPGTIQPLVSSGLADQAKVYLQGYLTAASVNL